jgi:hypothetical protein
MGRIIGVAPLRTSNGMLPYLSNPEGLMVIFNTRLKLDDVSSQSTVSTDSRGTRRQTHG